MIRKALLNNMKLLLLIASLFALPVLADQVVLTWDAPVDTTGIVGYRLYWGPDARVYTNSITCATCKTNTVSGLRPNFRYYFAATSVGTNGLESDFSNEVNWMSTNKPSRVLNVRQP